MTVPRWLRAVAAHFSPSRAGFAGVLALMIVLGANAVTRDPQLAGAVAVSFGVGLAVAGVLFAIVYSRAHYRLYLSSMQMVGEREEMLRQASKEILLLTERLQRSHLPARPTDQTVIWLRVDKVNAEGEVARFQVEAFVDKDALPSEDEAMDLIATVVSRVPSVYREDGDDGDFSGAFSDV